MKLLARATFIHKTHQNCEAKPNAGSVAGSPAHGAPSPLDAPPPCP